MSFAVGSLVKARGREWVVLPESLDDMLILRPLGGSEDEVTGIYLPLEQVDPAQFDLPDPSQSGDYRSSRLLRDAIRLGFRSSSGPFRSFGHLGVEPRPYQLVPLLMALKLDPVRLLIADDVGIGKTVEACLVARELLDRGEIKRLAVLCPPHLAEQWQTELKDKFHIEAELVLPGTATRLERNLGFGQSLFEAYPFVIVSTDFIKSDRRRDEFLRTCPEFVIVDEAHTCAFGEQGRGGRHQRYQLLKGLATNPERHLVLVTATPHSGNEDAFRSLLSLLNPEFRNLPGNISGKVNEPIRRRLAEHLVQRRRADIQTYMDSNTPFPDREDTETHYNLSEPYKKFFEKILSYARETVLIPGSSFHQRVRWWSALALLRSIASSPAAAVATLRSRATSADSDSSEAADEVGRRSVLDLDQEDSMDNTDIIPGSDTGENDTSYQGQGRRLQEFAREAEKLYGDNDAKLLEVVKLIKQLLSEGYSPIVFCRFIPTAEYLAEELRKRLPSKTEIVAITGTLAPVEREQRIQQMSTHPQRVLVATDCLSEGINLQEQFDAVFHYDLSWNPTRHEQREGRVDRYGQRKGKVRVVTYYGLDNRIDGIVLDVLLRKHKQIRKSLGISVPVPVDTNAIVEAIFEGLLLKGQNRTATNFEQMSFEFASPIKQDLFTKWDDVGAKEKQSRSMFTQQSIKVEEVTREMHAVWEAIGSGVELESFTKETLKAYGALVSGDNPVQIDLNEVPRALKETLGIEKKTTVSFQLPVAEGVTYLQRTHPFIEGLAKYALDTALDPHLDSLAKRCGVIRSGMVEKRTTLLLIRFRYHIITKRQNTETPLLAEDSQLYAFTGMPQNAKWVKASEVEKLLNIKPEINVHPAQAENFLQGVIDEFSYIRPELNEMARARGLELLDQHRRVRTATKQSGLSYRVEPHLPPDVLGLYIFLPKG